MSAWRLPLKQQLFWSLSSVTCRRSAGNVIASCPPATCTCAAMPADLEVDRDSQLVGTVAVHNKLLVVATVSTDWPSKIEEGPEEHIIQTLKKETSLKGRFFNPYFNSIIMASGFGCDKSKKRSIMVFPDGEHVVGMLQDEVEQFVQGYVLPSEKELGTSLGRRSIPEAEREKLPMQDEWARQAVRANHINKIIIFICGHQNRDSRCGILGPILETASKRQLSNAHFIVHSEPEPYMKGGLSACVGQQSHIGGHKFAGNVIVYLPKSFHHRGLARRCIWYGGVEPMHVDGIAKETLLNARAIYELLRGGMEPDGRMLNVAEFRPDADES